MKYVVTGGAGFIGSHLLDALMQKGHEVTVIDDLSTGKASNMYHGVPPKNFHFYHADICDECALLDAFKGADGVFHLAAKVSVQESIKNPYETMRVNGLGTLCVLWAAQQAGIKNVIFASSCAVYGNTPNVPIRETEPYAPMSVYASSKVMGEKYCNMFREGFGMNIAVLRFFNVYGPRQNPASEYAGVILKFVTSLKMKELPIIYGDGNQTRDFVHVEDVVQACVNAMMSKASGTYNIGSGRQLSINSLVDRLECEMGLEHDICVYEKERAGDIKHSCADITKAVDELGYLPEQDMDFSGLVD